MMLGTTVGSLIKDIELNDDIATEQLTFNDDPIEPEPETPQPETPQQPPIPQRQPTSPNPFPGEILSSNNACTIIKFGTNLYKVYLKGMIDTSDRYIDLISLLSTLTEEDIVKVILVNSPGGYVNSGMMILNAMTTTQATVITDVIGYAYSMAAVIWGYGNLIEITNGVVMFHNIIMYGYGNVNKVKDYAKNEIDIFERILLPIVEKGILTQEEYTSIKENNKDLYLHYTILKDRVKAYNETKAELITKLNNLKD